jgi:putative hydroxymethylpyrimidine transporter CytX
MASSAVPSQITVPVAEVPLTLAEPAPKALGFLDQLGLWSNLGVSLLGFGGALAVVAPAGFPKLSLAAAILATVVGTLIGTAMVAIAAVPGAQTGAPAMVLLRGLFGVRESYVPTVLNILQNIGWGTFELVIISTGLEALFHDQAPRWVFVLAAGAITTLLTLRPLGAVRILRRYVTVAVAITMLYLYVQVLRTPLPSLTHGSWSGFWVGTDTALAVAVSWVPLASDYSRHSKSSRAAFAGPMVGYTISQVACYVLGLVALLLVANDPDRIFGAFMAVPLGALFFSVLVLREVDQSFCNVYSTAVSVQNLRPLADRRVLALCIGALTTTLALLIDMTKFENFLYLIGAVFVPMFGVLAVDYFLLGGRRRWDLTEKAPSRRIMLVPWALGFAAYQLVNPGGISWWAGGWNHIATWLHYTNPAWMSASLLSFVVAGATTCLVGAGRRLKTAA